MPIGYRGPRASKEYWLWLAGSNFNAIEEHVHVAEGDDALVICQEPGHVSDTSVQQDR